MAISSITPLTSAAFAPVSPTERAGRTAATSAAGSGAGSGSESFGAKIGDALDALASSHAKADSLALQAATGDLTAVHDYTIASTEAQLMTQLTVEVRNRAIEAFNDIMRMQV
jgi:flagellar hook-basal body complex protein FliE